MLLTSEDRTWKLRRFLRHIIISAAKMNDSRHAWQRVHYQMGRIKEVSLCQGSEEEIEKEIKTLKQNIADYIIKEKKLTGYTHFSPYQDLLDKVNVLDENIERYLKRCGPEKTVTTEGRFKQSIESHQERIQQLEQHIKRIDDEYKQLAQSDQYDKKTLARIKKRLLEYKQKFIQVKKRVAQEFP